jgi:recombinational DNA repair protein (RecF pathway)
MAKYVLGEDYNVQENTQHGHAVTWREYLKIIDAKGYIPDFEAEAICKRHKNPKYFDYVVENKWLVLKR